MTKIGRNEPCPCGSGRKYKQCCMKKSSDDAQKAAKAERSKRAIAARLKTTPSCPAGAQKQLSAADAVAACLNTIHVVLQKEKVGLLVKLVDDALAELGLRPSFTYGDIAEHMANDGRFEIVKNQLCGLAGTNPVKLYVDKLGF